MMPWQFIVAIVLLFAIAMAIGTGVLEKHRRLIKIRKDSRTISWEEALRRTRTGHGAIVENATSLSGRLWWIEDSDVVEQDALYDEVEKRGLCVTDTPSASSVAQMVSDQQLSEKYRRLESEPFTD